MLYVAVISRRFAVVCVWEGGIGEGKAMVCGGVVAVLIGHGEALDLLECFE